ncbi:MAG: N-acetylglucosamine-6-phosphate deacetylase [Sphingobacteriales bacterium]
MVKRIFSKRVFTGDAVLYDQVLELEDCVIIKIEPSIPTVNVPVVENVCAGFIDLQINGGQKFYFTQHPTEETIADIDQSFSALGTFYTLPTLVTSPIDNILNGIASIRSYQQKNPGTGVLGMHLEGPFLNPAKRGAHLLKHIQKPTNAAIEEIIKYGKHVIKLITIAPELFNRDQIELLLSSGIAIAAGHSNATYKEAISGFNAGINAVTHLYNAMSPFEHRDPGLVGATFDSANVYAPIILDGIHCDFASARIAYQIKKDKLVMISDALFIGGKVKRFEWGQFNAKLKNGYYVNSDGKLAGSSISIADGLRNAVNHCDIPLQKAIEMSTIRPAEVLGLSHQIGKIAAGYPANFTVFDNSLSKFTPCK